MNLEHLSKKYLNENFTPPASGDMGSDDYRIMMEVVRAEEDTVYTYIELANQAKNPKLKKVIMDIVQEERVHAHEMQVLMKELQSELEADAWKQAEDENKELTETENILKKYIKKGVK